MRNTLDRLVLDNPSNVSPAYDYLADASLIHDDQFLMQQTSGLKRRLSLVAEKHRRRAALYKDNNGNLPMAKHRRFTFTGNNPRYKQLHGRERYVPLDEPLQDSFEGDLSDLLFEEIATHFEIPRGRVLRWNLSPNTTISFPPFSETLDYFDSTPNSGNLYSNVTGDSHQKIVPWRTRRDLKPNASKKYQNGARHKKRGYYGWGTLTHEPRKRPFRQRYKGTKPASQSTAKYTPKNLPLEDRVVTTVGAVHRACEYITHYEAKCQQFYHPNPKLNEALQVVLRYVQSKADRRVEVDIGEVVKGRDFHLNSRLSNWARKYELRIINLHDTLIGRFLTLSPEGGYKFGFIPFDSNVIVSSKYSQNPDRYITTQQEFISAVRGVLNRKIIDVDYFHILDPVKRVTLEWCMFQVSNGDIQNTKPMDVVNFRIPELFQVLKVQRLVGSNGRPIEYRYHFSKQAYEDATRKPYVLPEQRGTQMTHPIKKSFYLRNL